MTITMYDSIDVSQIPSDAAAAAGYVGGNWPTLVTLQRLFPHAHLLPVAISAGEDAEMLDVENGDATIEQAPSWVRRQEARGVYRPGLYSQASNMGALWLTVQAAGIARASVRLWSAHYGLGQHICGPGVCGYPIPGCDGTQWTQNALGRNLDQSLLLADFFDGPPPKPAPAISPEDAVLIFNVNRATVPVGTAWPGVFLLASDATLHHISDEPDLLAYQAAGLKEGTFSYAEYKARGGQ